jgi:hypothetical protein
MSIIAGPWTILSALVDHCRIFALDYRRTVDEIKCTVTAISCEPMAMLSISQS